MNLHANMVFAMREDEIDPAATNPRVEAYRPDFNAYNPQFKGLPEGTYPTKWYEWIIDVILLLPLYTFSALATFACVKLGVKAPREYGWSMVALLVAFAFAVLALCFAFAPQRPKLEREFMQRKIAEQRAVEESDKARQKRIDERVAAYLAELQH